jgi:hypothetical protein
MRFSLLALFVFMTLVAGVVAIGKWNWFAVPFATAVAVLIGACIWRWPAARAALAEGEDVKRAARSSLLVFAAALVALVVTRILIFFMFFEFRITPPPPDDELAMVLAGLWRDEAIAEATSLVPAVALIVLTWPRNRQAPGGP